MRKKARVPRIIHASLLLKHGSPHRTSSTTASAQTPELGHQRSCEKRGRVARNVRLDSLDRTWRRLLPLSLPCLRWGTPCCRVIFGTALLISRRPTVLVQPGAKTPAFTGRVKRSPSSGTAVTATFPLHSSKPELRNRALGKAQVAQTFGTSDGNSSNFGEVGIFHANIRSSR